MIYMREDKNQIEIYMIAVEYCPYCRYFNDLEDCDLKVEKTSNGMATCKNFVEME